MSDLSARARWRVSSLVDQSWLLYSCPDAHWPDTRLPTLVMTSWSCDLTSYAASYTLNTRDDYTETSTMTTTTTSVRWTIEIHISRYNGTICKKQSVALKKTVHFSCYFELYSGQCYWFKKDHYEYFLSRSLSRLREQAIFYSFLFIIHRRFKYRYIVEVV